MNRSILIALLFALLAGGWILSGQFGTTAETDQSTPVETKQEVLKTVRIQESIARPFVRQLAVSGRTEPSREIVLKAETEGTIDEIAAEEGSRLAPGDLIIRLAEDTRPAELAEAEALVAQRWLEYDVATKLKKSGHRADTAVAEAKAKLDEAETRRQKAAKDIEHTKMVAPFGGILDDRAVELGDFVTYGDEIGRLIDLDPILVTAAVSEMQRHNIEIGSPGSAELVTGEAVTGIIRFIAAAADPSTRTFTVELEVPNPDGRLVAGVTALLQVDLPSIDAHKTSPSILVLNDAGRLGVKVLDEQNRVRFKPVTIVATEPGGVWLGGLASSERLIVVGQDYVSEGETVEPTIVKTPQAMAAHGGASPS